MTRFMSTVVRWFLTGIAALMPLLVTLFLAGWVVGLADAYIGPSSAFGKFLAAVFGPNQKYAGYIVGYLVVSILVTLLGFLVTRATVARFRGAIDSTLARIPLFGKIYAAVGQVVDLFGKKDQEGIAGFRGCVQVEIGNVKMLALLTSAEKYVLDDGKEHVLVFFPNSPFPATGFNMLVPVDQVRLLDMPVEDLVKLLMSLGLLGPQVLKKPGPEPEVQKGTNERTP